MKALKFLPVTDTTGRILWRFRYDGAMRQTPAQEEVTRQRMTEGKELKTSGDLAKNRLFLPFTLCSLFFFHAFVNFGGLYIDWQPPNSLWKVLGINGIIWFWSGIYRHQQSNLILLHPSVTLIRTKTDAHFFIYIYYDDYVQALHLSHWWNNFHHGWPLGDIILEQQPQGRNVLHLLNPVVLFPRWPRQGARSTSKNDDLLLSHYTNIQAVTNSGREELESFSQTFRLFSCPPKNGLLISRSGE